MSSRHSLILLLTGACCLVVLLSPLGGKAPVTMPLGPIVSAAPPLVLEQGATGSDDPAMMPVREEASGALSRLKSRAQP